MKLPKFAVPIVLGLLALGLGGCEPTMLPHYHKGYFQDHPQTGNHEISSMGVKCYFCSESMPDKDSDNDGVVDRMDKCPTTPAGYKVDAVGCALDTDKDGVPNSVDSCPTTPMGAKVDSYGCALDSDGDGVIDLNDRCPGTPSGITVNLDGCPLDSDGDGVFDYMDKCPGTPANVDVDSDGCPLDSDGDGVYDHLDQCPGTPAMATVNDSGCWIINNLHFNTGKAVIKSSSYKTLADVAKVLKANPDLRVEVQGHTDSRGREDRNMRLSQARAESVLKHLVNKGISADRMVPHGYGQSQPIADNETAEGRATNRRVELKPIM